MIDDSRGDDRIRLRPWVSPWSLDDEWDDLATPPAPSADKEARLPKPTPKAQPPAKAPISKPLPPPQMIVGPVTPTVPAPAKAALLPPPEPTSPQERVRPATDKPSPAPARAKSARAQIGPPSFSWSAPILLSLGLLGLTFLAWVYWQDVPRESDEDLRLALPVDQALTISAPKRLRSFLESIRPLRNPDLLRQSPWQWSTPALSEFVGSNGAAFDNLRDLLEDYDWHPR
ncbi:MAG TPA: hypothetical protein VD994_03960, partial [Prosthecobacter sp.]|nr:hypothetical protein [Prosthecobacter sp.]